MCKKILLKSAIATCFLLFLTSCTSVTTSRDNNQIANLTTPTAEQLNNAANTNIELGLYYLEKKDIKQAQAKFLLVLQQAPQNFLAYDAMGYFLETIQEIPEAEKYYKEAIKRASSKNTSAAHNNYGAFLYRQHRCQEALEEFVLILHDINYLNLAAANENAGLAAVCLNEKVKAEKLLKKSLLIEPNRKSAKEILQRLLQK